MLKNIGNLGFYLPSYFLLNVNTDESLLKLDSVSKEAMSIFTHEYIHFLQDLFTLYGLWNINYSVNLVYAINQEGLQKDPLEFPIELNNSEIKTLSSLHTIYFGTHWLSLDVFSVESINVNPNGVIAGYEQVESVEIGTISFGGCDEFTFGAAVILESMAHIIEEKHFGIYAPPTFPYKIVDMIIDKFYNDLHLDPPCRVAVCEQALNSIHPGLAFIQILDKLREIPIKSNKPNDIHQFCERAFFLEDERKVKQSIPFALKAESRKSRANLKTYFPDRNLVRVNDWIDYVFDFVEKYKPKFHFSKVYEDYDFLVEVINELGTPLISTKTEYYFMNPEIDQADCHIAMLPVISELIEFALLGKSHCNFKSHCTKSSRNLVDNLCDYEPWKKRDQEPKCYLATLIFLWNNSISKDKS